MKLNLSNTALIKRLLVGRNNRPLQSILKKMEPADLASMFSSLNKRERKLMVDALLSVGKAGEALAALPEPQLEDLLVELEPQQLKNLLLKAAEEDAAYFLSLLPNDMQDEALQELSPARKTRIKQVLAYPEDSAGRMMQTQVFTMPVAVTANEGLEILRSRAQEESIYYIYCIDADNRLEGILSLRQLATAPAHTPLKDLIKKEIITVHPETPSSEVAQIVAHYDFVAVPVIDTGRRLVGIITVDDVLDIIQELATANIYAQAGLQEDDRVYTSPLVKIRNRVPWMFLNLLLAALASSVISLFEETMSQLIILASLKNIVAGVGGNTAIQTLTVVTRGIATGDFSFISHSKAIMKETFVGLTMGVITGLGAALLTYIWKGNALVSAVIFVSLMLNSLVAAGAGAMIPIGMKKLNLDPAAGSGVLATMITDIFGFFSFLGIATIALRLVQ